jgi:hypothetical protein
MARRPISQNTGSVDVHFYEVRQVSVEGAFQRGRIT